jgi:hypothetical protein
MAKTADVTGRLLDRFLPDYDFNEVHVIAVRASPERVYRAIKEVRPREIPLLLPFFALRGLPRLLMRQGQLLSAGDRTFLDQVLDNGGFILLAEEADRQLVVGAVGRFWQASSGLAALGDAQEFLAFDRPDWAKAAMDFVVRDAPERGGVVLRTETRIRVTGKAERRKFAVYWLFIRWPSGLLRRTILGAIKRRAERYERAGG